MTIPPRVLAAAPGCMRCTHPVGSTLGQLRLDGGLFFRGELSDPFEFENACRHPRRRAGAWRRSSPRCSTSSSGSCWIVVDDGVLGRGRRRDRHALRRPLRHGRRRDRRTGVDPRRPPPRLVYNDDAAATPWRRGAPDRGRCAATRTRSIHWFDPAMRALPPVFVVHLTDGPAARGVRASIDYAVLADAAVPTNLSPSPLATRLPELLLSEVLRTHLATAPAIDHGLDRRAARPAPRSGAGGAARRSGRTVDGCRAGRRCRCVTVVGRRPLPAGARAVADPLPLRPGACTWRPTSSPRRSCRCS